MLTFYAKCNDLVMQRASVVLRFQFSMRKEIRNILPHVSGQKETCDQCLCLRVEQCS